MKRALVLLRELLATHTDLARKIQALERRCDKRFRIVFDAIRHLFAAAESPRRRIGFLP